MAKVSAETYLVLVPDIQKWGGEAYVYGIRVDRIRASKPALKPGEIAVKLRLNFEKSQLIDSIPVIDLNVSSFSTPLPQVTEVDGEVLVNA
jgi:hypothetical protein